MQTRADYPVIPEQIGTVGYLGDEGAYVAGSISKYSGGLLLEFYPYYDREWGEQFYAPQGGPLPAKFNGRSFS